MLTSEVTDPQAVSLLTDLSSSFDDAPWAVTGLFGEEHIVRYVNSAFCQLIEKAQDEVVGRPLNELLPPSGELLALLDRVFRSGVAASYTADEQTTPLPLPFSCHLWPIIADGRPAGVLIEVTETRQIHETRLAICEALVVRAIHQDDLIQSGSSANVRLQTEATTDALTGLPNRRFFEKFSAVEFPRVDRFGEPLAVLMIDLDNFKRVNDQYGHLAGDEVLRRVAVTGSSILRASDLFVRYGGEEFLCLLPGTGEAGALVAAEKVRRGIENLTIVFRQALYQ